MAFEIGKFRQGQLRNATSWTGLTEDKHLHNAFMAKPQYLDKVIKYLVDIDMGVTFTRWMDQFPVHYIDNTQPYKWRLKTYNDKTVRLTCAFADEALTIPLSPSDASYTGTYRAGQYGAAIYLLFPEKRFSMTQHLIGQNPDLWQLRVQNDPIQVGDGWLYKCVLVTDNTDDFVDANELDKGTKWSSRGGSVPLYNSSRGQDISFSTAFEMEERLTAFRFQHDVHGEMIDSGKNGAYEFDLMDSEGGVHTYWISYMEWELIKQFYQKQAEIMFYGKATVDGSGHTTLVDDNGNPIVAGRGMREQFLNTNKHFYNDISLDLLTEVALDAVVGKVSPQDRSFVIGTGEWGLMELHKMLQREYKSGGLQYYSWLGDTTGRSVEWTGGSNNNEMKLKLGQFMSVAVINGIEFKFMWMPHYDDPIANKLQHPKGGMAESHRMTIMDFGSKDKPNIQKVRIKGREPRYVYIPGLRNPYEKGGSVLSKTPSMAASSFDGYSLHIMDWVGSVIRDPTRIIEFVPAVLRGY